MTTLIAPAPIRVAAGPIRPQRVSRLFGVELRKMIDTRSGKAVIALAVAVTAIALGWTLVKQGDVDPTWTHYAGVFQVAMAVLPVVGLLGMTAEWTQRTALTTFTQSPRRGRVLMAKYLASLTLSMGVLVVILGMIAGSVLIGSAISGETASYAALGSGLRSMVIVAVLQVTMAAGFGALAAQTAVAVGGFFLAPTVVAVVGFQLLGDNSRWLDVYQAYERLGSSDPWVQLASTFTSVAFWVLLPATIGVIRSLRREVK